MDLTDYMDALDGDDEEAEKRRLAEEKSYEIMEYVDGIESKFDSVKRGNIVGSKSPSVFVGRSNYPKVSTGILSPIGNEDDAGDFAVDSKWYQNGLDIDNVLQYRTGLLDSRKTASVDVDDVWDGFVGTQREVAMAQDPVDIELGVTGNADIDVALDDITSPRGPTANADAAKLTENPYVPKAIEKTLEDDDWKSTGAMQYLYDKGFDVYEISQILSTGTIGQSENRKLVPTRWSITAVDDTIGKYVREDIKRNPSINSVEVHRNEFMGNNYWVILAPGHWEYELVEMKDAGSVWNPDASSVYLASAYEGYEGRTQYVDETAGAYYASRLGVLEHLQERGRQAKALVLREVTDEYWAPVGVWQVRESVREAFGGQHGKTETMATALSELEAYLSISLNHLRRKSELASAQQTNLGQF